MTHHRGGHVIARRGPTGMWHICTIWRTTRTGQISHLFIGARLPAYTPGDRAKVEHWQDITPIPDAHRTAARWMAQHRFAADVVPSFASDEILLEALATLQAHIEADYAARRRRRDSDQLSRALMRH